LKTALGYVNEAIMLDEENAINYITKYGIYEGLERSNYSDKANYNVDKRRAILDTAEKIALRCGDSISLASVYDFLAYAWMNGIGADKNKAEIFALKAIEMKPNSPNAVAVLNAINTLRQRQEEQAEQFRKAEEASAERKRREIEVRRSESKRRTRKTNRNRVLTVLYVLAWVFYIGSFLYMSYNAYMRYQGVPYENFPLTFIALGVLLFFSACKENEYIGGTIGGALVFMIMDVVFWGNNYSDVFIRAFGEAILFNVIAVGAGSLLGFITRKVMNWD
jgi:hypothetical protein